MHTWLPDIAICRAVAVAKSSLRFKRSGRRATAAGPAGNRNRPGRDRTRSRSSMTPRKWPVQVPCHTPPRRRPAGAGAGAGTGATSSGKVKNPFERTLVESLGSSICSPGMFKIRETSGSFKWDIEHVSVLAPTEIVACSSQFEHTPDPVLELKATRAIERFFSQEVIVPSPFDEAPKRVPLLPLNEEEEMVKCDAWTQTMLTFPAVLPPETEELLKPFLTYTKDQNTYNEADLSANASLRRKLCFEINHSDDECDNEEHQIAAECPETNSGKNSIQCKNANVKTDINSPVWNNLFEFVTSPPLNNGDVVKRYSDEKMVLKSPSLSPIGRTPKRSTVVDFAETMTKFDSSPFSQSTPEKDSSIKSDLDISNSFDVDMNDKSQRFYDNDIMIQRAEKRSQSELSLNSLGRSRSAIKLDFCMDSDDDNSFHLFSSNGTEAEHGNVGDDAKRLNHIDQLWKMEMISDNSNIQRDHLTEIKKSVIGYEEKQESNLLHYYTPNRNADSKNFRKKQPKHNYSPMQMSFECDNSHLNDYKLFPSDTENKPQWIFHTNMNHQNITEDNHLHKGFDECSSIISKCDTTMCNTSKFDRTNSMHIDSLSTTNWRRFDSGFNEETSTDLSQQFCSQEFKQPSSQCSKTALFQEENKENIYFGEQFYNKHKKMQKHDSVSFSEIINDEIAQFACTYSSTPSKNRQLNF